MSRKDRPDAVPTSTTQVLSAVLDQRDDMVADPAGQNNTLWLVFQAVAKAAHIPINKAPPLLIADDFQGNLDNLSQNYGFRYRQVDFSNSNHQNDHGPLIVFNSKTGEPAALLKNSKGKYSLTRFSASGRSSQQKLTPALLDSLQQGCYSLYRPLPDKALNWLDLLKFGSLDVKSDIGLLLIASAMVSILGLLIPVATQILIDQIIPGADIYLLQQVIIALVCNVIAITLFSAAASVASMRLQLKMNASMQAALWDRLIRLPVHFFKRYSVGDLADRANNIDDIQQTLTQNVISTFINGLFSVMTLALMAYYDWRLALIGALLTLIFCLFNVVTSLIQLSYQRKMFHAQGHLSGIVLQFLSNISKLRFASKESQAFNIWSYHFTHINRLFFQSENIHNLLKVVSSVYPIISTAIIYYLVIKLGKAMSFGDFIGFNSAYGQFTAAILAMSGVVADSLAIIPLYERALPILSCLPENHQSEVVLDSLDGDIKFKNISFHYQHDIQTVNDKQLPWVFNDISLSISPGQTIALVGPSGCGKSSLFRLLLGFEQPQYGAIYYDGHKLNTINKNTLRSQIGVVLQDSALLPGTIQENILSGCRKFDQHTAWHAAKSACIDQDIQAMPMAMQTQIAEGGNNLSKGQQQRLLIAQALAKQPKLLFLDEATSALDNTTQAKITDHLGQLGSTCIIAAHRLSTVAHADMIYVFNQGKIIQKGDFETLSKKQGLFAEMMSSQTIQ